MTGQELPQIRNGITAFALFAREAAVIRIKIGQRDPRKAEMGFSLYDVHLQSDEGCRWQLWGLNVEGNSEQCGEVGGRGRCDECHFQRKVVCKVFCDLNGLVWRCANGVLSEKSQSVAEGRRNAVGDTAHSLNGCLF